jgi:phage recombination protein Bet
MTETKAESSLVKATESAAIQLTPGTVKRFISPLASEQEVALFLNQCVMFGLNPFKREIYLIKYKATDPATFVVGYEVYLKRAERTRNWAGLNSGVTFDKDGKLFSAWVDVYRKDWINPLHHEVYLSEYIQTKAEWVGGQATGKKIPTRFWAEKPITMLKKVAVAQAFRMAFPDEMAGMPYTSEEMPLEHSKLPTTEVLMTSSDYEEMKKKPLNDIQDEWTGGSTPQADNADEPVGPDLTDPKVNPFSGKKEEPRNAGEWPEGGAPSDFEEPKKGKAEKAGKKDPFVEKVQKVFDQVAGLVTLGVDEQMVWRSIGKKLRENFGTEFVEPSNLNEKELEFVTSYLGKWAFAVMKKAEGGK